MFNERRTEDTKSGFKKNSFIHNSHLRHLHNFKHILQELKLKLKLKFNAENGNLILFHLFGQTVKTIQIPLSISLLPTVDVCLANVSKL